MEKGENFGFIDLCLNSERIEMFAQVEHNTYGHKAWEYIFELGFFGLKFAFD